MYQSVKDCIGHDRVTKHLIPFTEVDVGGDDGASFLIAFVNQLEEQLGIFTVYRNVANFVYYQHLVLGEVLQPSVQSILFFCFFQPLDQVMALDEVGAIALLSCRDADTNCQVRFTHTTGSQKKGYSRFFL